MAEEMSVATARTINQAGPSRIRRVLPALATSLAVLAVLAPGAGAASTHPFLREWSAGSGCAPIKDVATDAAGNVYVLCGGEGANGRIGSIRKFTPTGVPITFKASKPYISGNEINEDPVAPTKSFNEHATIAIDKSSARPGWIYVADTYAPLEYEENHGEGVDASKGLDIFNPDGEYVTSIQSSFNNGEIGGVGVDDQGYIYASWISGASAASHISKYDPKSLKEILRIQPASYYYGAEPFKGPCCIDVRPDAHGAVWAGWGNTYWGRDLPRDDFGKYEPDQWSTDLRSGTKNTDAIVSSPSPYLQEKFIGQTCPEYTWDTAAHYPCYLEGMSFNVDHLTNDVYALTEQYKPPFGEGTGEPLIVPYSEGNSEDPVHQNGPAFGLGKFKFDAHGIEVDLAGNVWAGSGDKVVAFSRGAALPKVVTRPASLQDIGHTTAIVHALIDPAGGGPVTACQVAWGPMEANPNYGGTGSPANCKEATPYPDTGAVEVSAELTNLQPNHHYRFRFEASNASGSVFGADRSLEAKSVLKVETKPATEVGRNEAVLNGQLDADGLPTEYWFQYGPSTSYGQSTVDSEGKGVAIAGAPGEIKATPFSLVHLQAGKKYHYRLVARNSLGTTFGQDLIFRTVSPPDISGLAAEHLTETTADVHAFVDPIGYSTTYKFEYGVSPSYGSTIEGEPPLTGSGNQKVEAHLAGLPPAHTIHFRVVATNQFGTTESPDTTFSFQPPGCPNGHVRQITGSSYLPDCRAYELVSPGYAGAVQFLPGEALVNFNNYSGGLDQVIQTPQNLGYATSPSRFVYWGGLGSVGETQTPNSFLDVYLATRTTHGWVTSVPGLKGSETKFSFARVCSEDLSLCADHESTHPTYNPETGQTDFVPGSLAPYLYRADGKRLGRLPTNVPLVPGGTEFEGDWLFSGDFSHFFVSTQTKFTPDGLTSAPGSVYDNDISKGTMEIVSRDQNGEPIGVEPSVVHDKGRITGIAGVSQNGARILMAGTTAPYCDVSVTGAECPHILDSPARLYMRDTAVGLTYEVSREMEVNYVGMTRDGGKVFFTTTEQLIPGTGPGEDNDTSRDLYMWEAKDDSIHLISREAGLGNDDSCTASWVAKCGVQPLSPQDAEFSEHFARKAHVDGIDDLLARDSGDIYFYSPEDLVPGEVGGDGQRNLYLYRNGKLQFVRTFEPSAPVERSTISLDGSHAAFMTRSQLTGYENRGQREVYTYGAADGSLRCVSCNPKGSAPAPGAQVVTVAEAGPFMANDGRTFFATKEALVPQDTDGIRDVYEYVDGRPQLISSGTGDRENTGGLETVGALFGVLQIGLESVSRDGTDVYFASFEKLTPEDHNGSFLKFYDARVGGGFDYNPELGPCAAADECHGVSTLPPAQSMVGTKATNGSSGNLPAPGHHKKKHRKHRKKHGKHAKRHGGRSNG